MGKPTFPDATLECIDQTLESAHSCFIEYSKKNANQRADFLRRIADNLEKHRNSVIETAEQETSLGLMRLEGECSRTIDQIRLFATFTEKEEWKEISTEVAEPNRTPIPKPAMYKANHPIGPVVVIGACNFPLAISVVGTDTTSTCSRLSGGGQIPSETRPNLPTPRRPSKSGQKGIGHAGRLFHFDSWRKS